MSRSYSEKLDIITTDPPEAKLNLRKNYKSKKNNF